MIKNKYPSNFKFNKDRISNKMIRYLLKIARINQAKINSLNW